MQHAVVSLGVTLNTITLHTVPGTAVQPLYPAAEAPLCNKMNHCVQQTIRGPLTWQCYSAWSNNPEGTSVVQSTSKVQVVPALHKQK